MRYFHRLVGVPGRISKNTFQKIKIPKSWTTFIYINSLSLTLSLSLTVVNFSLYYERVRIVWKFFTRSGILWVHSGYLYYMRVHGSESVELILFIAFVTWIYGRVWIWIFQQAPLFIYTCVIYSEQPFYVGNMDSLHRKKVL